jgi:hypothetical protein
MTRSVNSFFNGYMLFRSVKLRQPRMQSSACMVRGWLPFWVMVVRETLLLGLMLGFSKRHE